MNAGELTGIRKAAILLLTMDEELSKEILKDLDEEEVSALGREISSLKLIPDDLVKNVHEEFAKRLDNKNVFIPDGKDKFKTLIKKSFGDDKADMFLESLSPKEGAPGEFIRTLDPRMLASALKGEHPQTMALVLSTLNSKKACDTVALLPEKMQSEVVMRMAFLERVDMNILREIENVLREQLDTVSTVDGKQLGGVELVANIFNQMDKTLEADLLGRLEESNPELADKIRQLMFTFDDLLHVDDRGIQAILKDISSEDLSVALKGATDVMKEKIFSNMSERAATMLKEDLEAMGPIRLSEVESAQIKIAMVAKKLDADGKIIISRGNEKLV